MTPSNAPLDEGMNMKSNRTVLRIWAATASVALTLVTSQGAMAGPAGAKPAARAEAPGGPPSS